MRAPTLVLHAREDAAVPIAAGRELAALIPGAEFVELDSKNHILLEGEPAWGRFCDAVRDFMGIEHAPRADGPRLRRAHGARAGDPRAADRGAEQRATSPNASA